MKQSYNKLVRDNIPQIIREAGKECAVETMSASEYESEYEKALRDKVMEEAQEVAEAEPGKLGTRIK